MEILKHDQFVIRVDGSRRLTQRNRFSRLYNPMSTSIDTKVFYGSCGNLPSPCKGSVDHECLDSLDNFGEHSDSANTGEPSEVEKRAHSSFMVPAKNNVPLALSRLRDYNAPGKLEDRVLYKRNGQK